ncbi:cytochrome P450 [Allonocardiopsis opalescens]|uniref:Cytochrome P450 n=1 Tax=Allonocardiopsis opalescens TaxID=1144618 RepID=A0A2T0PYV0_9ACTN|nr:cytochrome P450 [Allonocardiopsis opalescens]PRX96710.1 cytochrome P450 [Allonocardiopsis opalescens]
MTQSAISLPWEARTERRTPFDQPGAFARLREERPLRPMVFADGHEGWLATGYEAVRAILADGRFSVRRELTHPPVTLPNAEEQAIFHGPPPPGMFVRMDPPEHTRYRKLLAREFTARRMRRLEERVAEVTGDHLDGMERTGPPADLVQALARPVPSLLICELLGIPDSDMAAFRQAGDTVLDPASSPEEVRQGYAAMLGVFPPLIARRRAAPTEDVFSGLVNGGGLSDEELTSVGLLLFAGGMETTTGLLGFGTFTLLHHPDQLQALRRDPGLIDGAVEELLRFITGPGGMLRTALEDVRIEGELIRKGQTVELLVGAANHDPARFERPDEFDIVRSGHGHLAFGHGVHQCLGQHLARVELRTVFPALFQRFPGLRLAVPSDEVPMRTDSNFYSVTRLPVEW